MDQILKKHKLLRTPLRAKVTRYRNALNDLLNRDDHTGYELIISRLEGALDELKLADACIVDRLTELNETNSELYPDCTVRFIQFC